MRRLADLIMGSLARLLIRIFFRHVEVEHGERITTPHPTVLVANHRNGLVDGLLLMAALQRYPRFLGKSTLFRIAPLWPFLKLAGVVPVYRAQDGGSTVGSSTVGGSTERNAAAFARSRSLLAAGGTIAIFPEGISHDEPELQPLRTGAARIALGASVDDGIEGVAIVAVGLAYDAKARFRSRALVRVGVPQPVDRWSAEYRLHHHQAVRTLTDDIAELLHQVSPDYESWRQVDDLAAIAEVIARSPHTVLPQDVRLATREQLTEALAGAEAAAASKAPGAAEALRAAFDTYQRHLALLGLTDAQVAADYRSGRLRWIFLWAVVKVVAALPFAAVGVVIHVIPYQAVKGLARLPHNDGMRATVKLLGCFASFTLVYAAIGVVVGHFSSPLPGVAAALLAPACGYTAVRLSERAKRIGGALEGARAVRAKGRVLESVLAHRAGVVAAADVVLGGVTGSAPGATTPPAPGPAP